MDYLACVLTAVAIARGCGEVPASMHPVTKMGKLLDVLIRPARVGSPASQLICGGIVALGLPLAWAWPTQLSMLVGEQAGARWGWADSTIWLTSPAISPI